MRFLTAFRLLLLGLWLGAAVFFVVMAQNAFQILPTHEVAGLLVSRTLAILNYSGLGAAFVLILTSLIVAAGTNIAGLWLERILLVIFGLGCAVGQFVIGWWMLLIRTQMGKPIDEVAADDPLRIQFDQLHQYSTWVMGAAVAGAFLAFVIISVRRVTPPSKGGIDPLDFQKQFKI
jgi:Domain of unknown function (DUF4149)